MIYDYYKISDPILGKVGKYRYPDLYFTGKKPKNICTIMFV